MTDTASEGKLAWLKIHGSYSSCSKIFAEDVNTVDKN
jgi:hypothetical protein